jgi:uncharacterized membrane protein YeaQ/YmgE (transglycosylase-associated protein family)
MYLLAFIFIGAVVGWGAGRVLQGDGYGPFMDILTGIGGVVLAGFLMKSVGISGYRATVLTAFIAIVCAFVMSSIVAMANGRRILARQL